MPIATEAVSRRVLMPSILLSILLIIFGFLAITLPAAASIGVALVIGWLVLFSGLVQLIHAFESKGIGHVVWKLLVAAFYLAAGAYLIARPALGLRWAHARARHIFQSRKGLLVDVTAYFSTRKRVAARRGCSWMELSPWFWVS